MIIAKFETTCGEKRWRAIKRILEEAIKNGYGQLNAEWSIKLWLRRN